MSRVGGRVSSPPQRSSFQVLGVLRTLRRVGSASERDIFGAHERNGSPACVPVELRPGGLMGLASWEIAPLEEWIEPARRGAVLAGFEYGVQPWVVWRDLGHMGSLVECGVPCSSGRRPSECLGPVGSPD